MKVTATNRERKNLNVNTLAGWLLLLVAILFSIKCISTALTTPFEFDGAMNAQVAQNLIRNRGYTTSYDGGATFDERIQTGAPVILPAALLFKLFGETFAAGLAVNALYMILYMAAVLYYLKRCRGLDNLFALLGLGLLYATPSIFLLGFGLYGEIPALFYLLLALIFISKNEATGQPRFLFYCGLAIGLAFLTKTVALILVPALSAAALVDILFKKRMPWKDYLRQYAALPLGLLIPVGAFELYKIGAIGWHAYIDFWKVQARAILMQAGVRSGFADTPSRGAKLLTHLQYLAAYTGLHPALLAALLVLLLAFLAIVLAQLYRSRGNAEKQGLLVSNDLLALVLVTLSYSGWWLVITTTQKAWYRRIIDGVLLYELCFAVGCYLLYRQAGRWAAGKNTAAAAAAWRALTVLVALAALLLPGLAALRSPVTFQDSDLKAAYLEAGQFIQDLPAQATIFGYQWYQVPAVSFTSRRNFYDINRALALEGAGEFSDKYLVVDDFELVRKPGLFFQEIPNPYPALLDSYDKQVVFARGYLKIYKLSGLRPLEFSDQEKGQVSAWAIDFQNFGSSQAAYVKNVYVDEPRSGKWAQPRSAYLLRRANKDQLVIRAWFPGLNGYIHEGSQVELKTYVNGQLVDRRAITREGDQEMLLPLAKIQGDTLTVELVANAIFNAPGDARKLSFVIKGVELR